MDVNSTSLVKSPTLQESNRKQFLGRYRSSAFLLERSDWTTPLWVCCFLTWLFNLFYGGWAKWPLSPQIFGKETKNSNEHSQNPGCGISINESESRPPGNDWFQVWGKKNTRSSWNVLTYQIEKKLLKTARVMSKGPRSQPEESPTLQRWDNWNTVNNYCELKYINKIICCCWTLLDCCASEPSHYFENK